MVYRTRTAANCSPDCTFRVYPQVQADVWTGYHCDDGLMDEFMDVDVHVCAHAGMDVDKQVSDGNK